jgi:hypothetical protein
MSASQLVIVTALGIDVPPSMTADGSVTLRQVSLVVLCC